VDKWIKYLLQDFLQIDEKLRGQTTIKSTWKQMWLQKRQFWIRPTFVWKYVSEKKVKLYLKTYFTFMDYGNTFHNEEQIFVKAYQINYYRV
jgi:hypothetical protein